MPSVKINSLSGYTEEGDVIFQATTTNSLNVIGNANIGDTLTVKTANITTANITTEHVTGDADVAGHHYTTGASTAASYTSNGDFIITTDRKGLVHASGNAVTMRDGLCTCDSYDGTYGVHLSPLAGYWISGVPDSGYVRRITLPFTSSATSSIDGHGHILKYEICCIYTDNTTSMSTVFTTYKWGAVYTGIFTAYNSFANTTFSLTGGNNNVRATCSSVDFKLYTCAVTMLSNWYTNPFGTLLPS
jgi:hypothetical protein